MNPRPSDIAPEVPELQEERQRFPRQDETAEADDENAFDDANGVDEEGDDSNESNMNDAEANLQA